MDPLVATANILKVLAHPVRLQIVQVLKAEGEACVCHLEACLDQRQSYISQHLAKLREAGLVTDRKEGLNVYYALTRSDLPSLIDEVGRIAGGEGDKKAFSGRAPFLETASPDCPCPKCSEKQS